MSFQKRAILSPSFSRDGKKRNELVGIGLGFHPADQIAVEGVDG